MCVCVLIRLLLLVLYSQKSSFFQISVFIMICCSELATVPNGPTEKGKRNWVPLAFYQLLIVNFFPSFSFDMHAHVHTHIHISLWLSASLSMLTVHYENILFGLCVYDTATCSFSPLRLSDSVLSCLSNCFPFLFGSCSTN